MLSELEAARVNLSCLEVVEGTKVRWHEAMRHMPTKTSLSMARSAWKLCPRQDIEIALGVVEGKPVWIGDRLWNKLNGLEYSMYSHNYNWDNYSWTPPKPKTVMVELPINLAQSFIPLMLSCTHSKRILANACNKALEELK